MLRSLRYCSWFIVVVRLPSIFVVSPRKMPIRSESRVKNWKMYRALHSAEFLSFRTVDAGFWTFHWSNEDPNFPLTRTKDVLKVVESFGFCGFTRVYNFLPGKFYEKWSACLKRVQRPKSWEEISLMMTPVNSSQFLVTLQLQAETGRLHSACMADRLQARVRIKLHFPRLHHRRVHRPKVHYALCRLPYRFERCAERKVKVER